MDPTAGCASALPFIELMPQACPRFGIATDPESEVSDGTRNALKCHTSRTGIPHREATVLTHRDGLES